MTPLIETFTPETLAQRTSDPAYWAEVLSPTERAREMQAIALKSHLEALEDDALAIMLRCQLLMRGLDAGRQTP